MDMNHKAKYTQTNYLYIWYVNDIDWWPDAVLGRMVLSDLLEMECVEYNCYGIKINNAAGLLWWSIISKHDILTKN